MAVIVRLQTVVVLVVVVVDTMDGALTNVTTTVCKSLARGMLSLYLSVSSYV